ncbi:MAG: hypothetical protein OHK0029_00830 [Armatimonadaceae bacterium]
MKTVLETTNETERIQMTERIRDVYEASRTQTHRLASRAQNNRVLMEEAKLYFRYPLPLWPPQMLFRKIIRRVILPFFMPQVRFNEAVRDLIVELEQRLEQASAAADEANRSILELEEKVEELNAEIRRLRRERPSSFSSEEHG